MRGIAALIIFATTGVAHAQECPDGQAMDADGYCAPTTTPTCEYGEIWDGAECAEPPPPQEMGHFPWLSFAVAGGLVSHGGLGGAVGAELRLRHDTSPALLYADVVGNALGDPFVLADAGLVFAKHLGGRSTMKLAEQADQGDYTITTTYNYKNLPLVYGVTAGASVFALDDGPLASGQAGFALVSPQIELGLEPALDVNDGAPGLHWDFVYGLPIGHHIFFFPGRGDHFFGSSARMSTVLLFTIGATTGTGVAPG